jgi:transglutaminase-like putative cysteine protease
MMDQRIESSRPRADWPLYLLVLAAALCLPRVLLASGWMPQAERLVTVTLWAVLFGVALGRSHARWGYCWAAGLAVGLVCAAQVAGSILPPRAMALGDLQNIYAWLQGILAGADPAPDWPLSYGLAHLATQSGALFTRVVVWIHSVQSGTANADNATLTLGVCWLTWILAWSAGYQAGRGGEVLLGLLPLGVCLLADTALTGLGVGTAQAYLVLTLLAWLWASTGRREWGWRWARVKTRPWLRTRTFLAGLPLGAAVLVVALLIPYGAPEEGITWERAGTRLRTVYQRLDRLFAGHGVIPRPNLSKVITRVVAGPTGVVPQSLDDHDLGGSPPVGDDPVFSVVTSDRPAAPGGQPPRHYWRERTYDQYTGRGWSSSPTSGADFAALAVWKQVEYPHTTLTQTYSFPAVPGFAPAVNEPVSLAQAYHLLTRGAGDLGALGVGASVYTVTSAVPDATVPELRAASGPYPDWVAERDLQLPQIPARVRLTAQRVVQRAGATTRYDQARAIETYLRSFAYDLELPSAPADTDVVSYFLNARRGYCDYAATAMVVMLRSLGIAARYASGYGPGEWDGAAGRWVARSGNAHAWAEVYFPGYGWIEFEPTPAQALPERALVRPTPSPMPTADPASELPGVTDPTATPIGSATHAGASTSPAQPPLGGWWGGLLAGGGALLLLLVVLPSWRRAQRNEPRAVIIRAYEGVLRRARWLGVPLPHSQTPREALECVAAGIKRRSGLTRQVARDLLVLGRLYEHSCYASQMPGEGEGLHARAAGDRLQRALTRALFHRVRRPA